MKISNLGIIILIFKIICGIVTLFMVGYWVHKFQKNEDVSQVEYTSVKAMTEVMHPETTICIFKPFLDPNIKENVNVDDYLKYLAGNENPAEKYENIRILNVTINIFDYVKYPVVLVKRDNTIDQTSCASNENCQSLEMRNSFNGFIKGEFAKCFSVGINPKFAKNVADIMVYFDPSLTEVLELMQGNGYGWNIIVYTNYRHQVSKYVNKYQVIWQMNSKTYRNIGVVMSSTEILRRRNKWDDPCLTNWTDFDGLLMNEHIARFGCSNPYLTQNKPTCSSAAKMKESMYEMEVLREHFQPCEVMSNVEIDYLDYGINTSLYSKIPAGCRFLRIEYASDVKIITQAPSVDLHSLIGSIGGYIGLFLGTSYMNYLFVAISWLIIFFKHILLSSL